MTYCELYDDCRNCKRFGDDCDGRPVEEEKEDAGCDGDV